MSISTQQPVPLCTLLTFLLSLTVGCAAEEGEVLDSSSLEGTSSANRDRKWKATSIDDVLAINELHWTVLKHIFTHQSCVTDVNTPPDWVRCDFGRSGVTRENASNKCNISVYHDNYEISIHRDYSGPINVTYYDPPVENNPTSLMDFGLPSHRPDIVHQYSDQSVNLIWVDFGPAKMVEVRSYPQNPNQIFYISIWSRETRRMQNIRDGLYANRSVDEIDCSDFAALFLEPPEYPFDSLHLGAAACIDPALH